MKAVATMVLGDDHVVFLDALAAVLTQHGHFVRAVAPGVDELVESVRSTQPEVCLINRYLDVDDLADVIGRVIGASGGTRVIVLSGAGDTVSAPQALDAGASGYVHKSRGVSALISAVERVLAGNVVVNVRRRQTHDDQPAPTMWSGSPPASRCVNESVFRCWWKGWTPQQWW